LFLGDDLVDKLKWSKGQALIGQSYGRFPDGSDATHTLEPSPMVNNSKANHRPLLIIADLIREHVANDSRPFYSLAEFDQNLNSAADSFYGLTEFMTYRVNDMTKQLQGDQPSAGDGRGFCSNAAGGPLPP
jgi:hypothetical protein